MSIKIVKKQTKKFESRLFRIGELGVGDGVYDGSCIYANFCGKWVAFGGSGPRVVSPEFSSFSGRKVRLVEIHYEEID